MARARSGEDIALGIEQDALLRTDLRTDDALWSQYRAGDAAAFDVLYERYRRRTYGYFARQLSAEVAADCHQELWIRVIDRGERYTPQGRFDGWLFTIALRVLQDHWRATLPTSTQNSGADHLDQDSAGLEPGEEQTAALTSQRSTLLREAMQSLPETQREALSLRYFADLSAQDVAEVTGAPLEAVRSRIRYATATLRKLLGGDDD